MTEVGVSKLRILVVDDEPSVGEVVRMLLRFDGHDVSATHSGKDALAMLERNRYDLVITDFAMPGMNGDQLASTIKAARPAQPVIMITGHAGMLPPRPSVDYIVGKPFQLEDLRDAIASVLPKPEVPVELKEKTPAARANV